MPTATETNVRVRYAPSPTGALHVGNIRTALWDWLYARHTGGTFILRIEDTDKNRETADGLAMILDAMREYGLDYDEGPGVGGPHAPYIQSQRLDIYGKYVEQLLAEGKAYRAYDTPEELARMRESQQKRGLPPGYDRRHRYITDAERADYDQTRGQYATVRFAVPLEGETTFTDAVYGEITVQNRILEDAILLKSDGFPTYHLAAQVDDHLMEISHVLRGEEWLPSAPLHILIHRALGWEPPIYAHLPVMMGPDKKKFGKRNGALGALEYPKQGYLQNATINFLAMQGWSPKEERDLFTVPELIEKFDLNGILNRSPISDPEKLLWFNGQYLRKLTLPELAQQTLPFLQDAGLVGDAPNAETLDYIGRVLALEQERMKTLAEAPLLADFFLLGDDEYLFDDKAAQKWLNHPGVADRLRRVRDGFAALEVFSHDATEEVVRATVEAFGVKGGDVIHPVRVAISGRTNGPGLFDAIVVLGRERCIKRLDRALGMINSQRRNDMSSEIDTEIEEQPTKELLDLKRKKVSLDQLYLDPNNPRFGEGRFVSDDRIAQPGTQDKAQEKIEKIGIDDLLTKIRQYGFVPTDPIAVRKFADGQFVVLEGNRRTAALKKLVAAQAAGETFDEDLLASMTAFEVLVYEGENPNIVWLLQGLRHMSGIREWKPLQQAAFISKIEEQVISQYAGRGRPAGIPTVARSAGVSTATASRLLKSYSAFIQAREDEEYGSSFRDPEKGPDKFSMFTEAVFKNDALQKWLGWNNVTRQFDNESNFKKLLEWVTPPEAGGPPKIVRALDARDILPGIIENSDLLRKFENGTIDLEEARFELSQRKNLTREPSLNMLRDRLQELLNAVDSLPMPQIKREDRQEEFDNLLSTLKQSVEFQIQHQHNET